jgi:ArsR family metal-binding transcriptional regulator
VRSEGIKDESEYDEVANNLFLRLKEAYDARENPRPFDTALLSYFAVTRCRRHASK